MIRLWFFGSMQFSSRAACETPNVLQVHFLLFWTCARYAVEGMSCFCCIGNFMARQIKTVLSHGHCFFIDVRHERFACF